MSVDIILNRRSRANRRDPGLADRMTSLVGGAGRVLAVSDLSELDVMTRGLAAAPPQAIAVHGGDGTLHKTLSSLIKAFAGAPLPPIAILPGGTMNVVGSSLGLLGPPEAILRALVAAVRAQRPVATVQRHCLKVADEYGFVFGNGLIANFLEEYYSKQEYSGGRALYILARTFLSGLVSGPYADRIVRKFEGRVLVDGTPLPWHSLTGVGAATVREVGLGFKLNHRADEDPERFSYSAVHAGPVALGLDLYAVHRGKGLAQSRAHTGLGTRLRIEPATSSGFSYTIDGDMYKAEGPLDVALGPTIRFFRWRENAGRR